ncbi:MAG: DMT family transporter [Clostridia bacterium]|nr:DMT family transporter [Clostridia bacterium]
MTALMVALLVFLFSLQSLFLKLFSESYDNPDSTLTSTVFSVSYGLFAGLATLILAGFRFAPSPVTLGLGALNALMLLAYTTSMIQASRCGSYAFQMISVLFGGILVPMLYGALFLGESLTALQIAAVALMLVSFVLMNLKGLTLKGSSNRFLLWCLALFLSNGFYGVLMNLQQARMNGAQRNEMIMLTFLGMAVLYAVIQLVRDPKALTKGFRMSAKPRVFLLLCCCVATAAVHMMLYVLTLVDETVLYTIDNGGVLILSVLYSFLFFHEKLSRVQLIGIALAAASIVMLSV